MKKITLLIILNLSFFIFNSQKASAQYVTIPDTNFKTWLTQHYPGCMNGNQMDTTCSGIVNEDTIIVIGSFISNLSGIQYFDNLIELICSNNQLTSLPALPSYLQHIECTSNQLSSLPALPNSLTQLECAYNQLGSLPTLPNSLLSLWCNQNQLNSLPTLPNSLTFLNCSDNQFSSLPTLPNSLTELYCYNNQLTNLPALPNSLAKLGSTNNQLISLPALPSSLQYLLCSNNQLTYLPILPNCLAYLECGNNQLSSIPQVPNSMLYFKITNNNITCVNNLPQVSNQLNANISNNPLTCLPNQTNYSLGLPLCEANDVINNPNNCQSVVNITGNVYSDLNNNCAYNNTDLNTQNIPVKLFDNQNNIMAISYTINGLYSFAALQPDSFKVKIDDVSLPLDIACSQSNNLSLYLDSINQIISNVNIPVVCDSALDIEVKAVNRSGWVFPGQIHTLQTRIDNNSMWYNLNCNNTIYSGTVTINISGPVTYVAPAVGALTPIINGNMFIYNITNFNNLTPYSFGLKLQTDTTAQIGNHLCMHVIIATIPSDLDTTNNEYDFCYNVSNSLDPNMKEVYPTNVLPGYNDWFTYTIHFQNTGTAPAFNIRLRDTLDTQLDLNTFEFLGASHTANTSLNGNVLSIRFNNIMLPDSTTNHDGSMGYYQYRIKPKPNLLNGSNIKNTAYIYFDYNPAVVTNTTENHFDITTSPSQPPLRRGAVNFYPNPSSENFNYTNLPKNSTIIIYNLLGEVCLTHYASLPLGEVGGASLPKGVYFAKVNGVSVVKLVKE